MTSPSRTYKFLPNITGRYRSYFRTFYALVFINFLLVIPIYVFAEHTGLPLLIPRLYSTLVAAIETSCCLAVIGPHIPALRAKHESKRYAQAVDCVGWGTACGIPAFASLVISFWILVTH